MTPRAYYNENDPAAAAWLRELIKEDLIADGDVDERSILDVRPCELECYTSCHFFAGIGGWSLALRLAGWPDDRRVWTGSCPCQPFSAAGKGIGVADERHLWPAWLHLIRVSRPSVVFGEQVEAAINHGWLDLVQADLEGEDYAFGAVGLPAAGFGAPHIRARLWFVADTDDARSQRWNRAKLSERAGECAVGAGGASGDGVAESESEQYDGGGAARRGRGESANGSAFGGLAHPDGGLTSDRDLQRSGRHVQLAQDEAVGFWSACDWLPCRDNKFRPVEPGTFPLAHGVSARVGRLRGYGNAIVPQVAAEVIAAYMGAE